MDDWNETIQSINKTDELMAEITRLRALVNSYRSKTDEPQ